MHKVRSHLKLSILILIYILWGPDASPCLHPSVCELDVYGITPFFGLLFFLLHDLHILDLRLLISLSCLSPLTSPPAMIFCSGCRRNFTPSGYTRHIRRSHTLACAAAHHEALQAAELDNNVDDMPEVIHFHGDIFGDYEETDLQWPAEAEAEVDEDSEDSEEGHDVLNDNQYIDIDMDPRREETQAQSAALDDCQGTDSVFVEHFPDGNAGAIISGDGFIEADYDLYQKQCGNVNEYAPFASQMEWDIARWAKVHGITSTAVTDLLGIKGVGILITFYVYYLTLALS
jgi:hypothetical protein